MAEVEQVPGWWQLMRQNFKWKQFVIGALIPITGFYILHSLGRPLTGAILAACWGLALSAVSHLFLKKVNFFALLAIPFAVMQLAGVYATRDPDFFLVWPAVGKTIWASAFLGSLLFSHPLIQILAEAMGGIPESETIDDLKSSGQFRRVWAIITTVWGVTFLVAALVLVACLKLLPLEPFLVVRTVLGPPLTAALIAFSFWFPVWYFKRSQPADEPGA